MLNLSLTRRVECDAPSGPWGTALRAFGLGLLVLLAMAAFGLAQDKPAPAAGRKALVIGIDGYRNVDPLQKALNDAQAVADVLTGIGFAVTLHKDPDRRAFLGGLSAFAASLDEGDEVVVYFAGHGIEMQGRNFLLAADVPALRSGDDAFLAGEGIAVDLVMDTIAARHVRVATYILDACRNNPFAAEGTRGLGGARGLAVPPAVEGTFVIYSAAAGQTALDRLSDEDPDPNSVFTRVLLPLLATPGLSVSDLAILARQSVQGIAQTAGHAQRISFYNELNGDYVLNPAPAESTAHAPGPAPMPDAAPDTVPDAVPDAGPRPDASDPARDLQTKTDLIRATQAELLRIGCNAGPPDGVAGAQTEKALRFYALLKGWGDDLPGEIGSDTLLAALKVEPDRVCASRWIADHVPMALSGDWAFSMSCASGLGAEGTAVLAVDEQGRVRGAFTNQNGKTRAVKGQIAEGRFSGEIDGRKDGPLAFDLALSDFETRMEGRNAFDCLQTLVR